MPEPLYHAAPPGVETRWASFENLTAGRGTAGQANRGFKGAACKFIAPGETQVLLDFHGSGLITRFWMTQPDRTPEMLRSLRLEMFWDGAVTPAVSAPLGDFFGAALGRLDGPFTNELFSSPEGKSFNCFIPMPFRTHARVTLTNEHPEKWGRTYYDIDFLSGVQHPPETLYFHAHWRRDNPNDLGQPFVLLPEVRGRGRFLGTSFGINTDPAYLGAWWGEGEFKAWLDGDGEFPTLCGSGEEDYIGTGWGQGEYSHPTQGCLLSSRRPEGGYPGSYSMYRFHTVDPVYFHQSFRAAIDTLGGTPKDHFLRLQAGGAEAVPCLFSHGKTRQLLLDPVPDPPVDLADPACPNGFVLFTRRDDWCGTSYFYLDRPENDLPPLAPLEARLANLAGKEVESAAAVEG
jgi:hypothetical protein